MTGTAVLAGVGLGAVALAVIIVSNYCYGVGESAVGSFLPKLARPQALGRVSGWVWGWG